MHLRATAATVAGAAQCSPAECCSQAVRSSLYLLYPTDFCTFAGLRTRTGYPAMLRQQHVLHELVHGTRVKAVFRSIVKCRTTCRANVSTERQPRRDNVGLEKDNAVFVDHTCIDCDTCRWILESVMHLHFDRLPGMTADTLRVTVLDGL
jgi:hypothetical protein